MFGSMKSPVGLEPEAFDVWARGLRHTVGLGVDLQLLQVACPCGVLDPQSGRYGSQPVVALLLAQVLGRPLRDHLVGAHVG